LLLDRVAETVTDFHIFIGKPAPHPLVLKITVQSLNKDMVLTRIANEAGVELDQGVRTQA
jgi:hypothetical protein